MARYIDVSQYEDCRIVLNGEDEGVPVKDISTADVQEVRYGSWKICGLFDDFAKCSCCGYKETANHAFLNRYKYCPRCGAELE